MWESPEYYCDQTSLTRLIHAENPDLFGAYYRTGRVSIGDYSVSVKTFPCEVYNYNWIEEGVDVEKNKIWHFKGSRHSAGNLEQLLASVDMDQ